MRAPVLVQGASGFTGRLICAALARRGVPFAAAGRDARRLERLGAAEVCVTDIGSPDSLARAVADRALVCAAAGPFVAVGEALLASCALRGVRYVDTTGEQAFVALARARYHATAEARGACIVPAMAFEIALADWGAHLAAEALGGRADTLAIVYANAGGVITRGTKKSALGVVAGGGAKQWVDGALADEPPAAVARELTLEGRALRAVSFPGPEALVTPAHTGARTLRTFMVVPRAAALAVRALGRAAPTLASLARRPLERAIDRAAEGPDEAARAESRFAIVCEATRGDARAVVRVRGRDPYGLTAEIQAHAAERALAAAIVAKGVVAPSVAFDARASLDALAPFGVSVEVDR